MRSGTDEALILLVTHAGDDHARAVRRALSRLGAGAVTLDLARFPGRSALRMSYEPEGTRFVIRDGGREVEPAAFDAVWWRRPRPFAIPASIRDRAHRAFAERAAHHAVGGLWLATRARWVNDPVRQEAASRKTWQLALAREVGLAIPRTLVTNDPARARAFVRSCGRRDGAWNAITKLVGPTEEVGRGTFVVTDDHFRALGAMTFAPIVYQEYVDGVDLRVTFVDGRIFAAEVDARRTAAPHDCRLDFRNARVGPARLPREVALRLAKVVGRLGLAYAAFDLRRTDGGDHVFLELNPSGQWLAWERAAGLPVTEAVARLLARRRRPSVRRARPRG
ncbi:MAG TPA: alpha-L-glutamate ligase [Anaeromyxobacteraceae bacterium]|nr:alpha-L-glutamate ligase [Anaeromyxobacteraceae bacterium]